LTTSTATVLVAHSYGGMVATEAGISPNVAALGAFQAKRNERNYY